MEESERGVGVRVRHHDLAANLRAIERCLARHFQEKSKRKPDYDYKNAKGEKARKECEEIGKFFSG
jgi:hypothetical protein